MTKVEETIEVAVPRHVAYNQWTQFEQFPRFMQGVQEVRQVDDAHLHWTAKYDGQQLEWDTELTQQVPDEVVSWRATTGDPNSGTVRFVSLGENNTRVTLEMASDNPRVAGGDVSNEHMMSQRIREDMHRFKSMLENQGSETGAWRGEIQQGRTVQPQQTEGQHQAGSGSAWLPHLAGMWEEPFAMMRRMSEEMDRMVERFIGRSAGFSATSSLPQWTPPIEVAQVGNEMLITADLPGLSSADVNVEVRGDKLLIEGHRQENHHGGDPLLRRSERRYGRFYRMIALPHGADVDTAQAVMENGVLQVRLPIASVQNRGRTIEVQKAQLPVQGQPGMQAEQQQPGSQVQTPPLH